MTTQQELKLEHLERIAARHNAAARDAWDRAREARAEYATHVTRCQPTSEPHRSAEGGFTFDPSPERTAQLPRLQRRATDLRKEAEAVSQRSQNAVALLDACRKHLGVPAE